MAINSSPRATSLRANCLSFPEVLAQSIALIAPTLTAALNAPLVFASTGNGAWLAYVFATIGLVLVGLNINQFARHSASPGALYTYIAKGLGSTAGIICGWALTLAYLMVAGAEMGGFAHYANLVLQEFDLQIPSILLGGLCVGVAWYYAYTDIQLSAVLMLLVELVSVGFILFLIFLVLAKHGFHPDVEQLTLVNVTPGGMSLGMVLAVFSYVGFESTTTLGNESRQPFRFIPRSLIWSTVLTGVFFILVNYMEVLGFRGYKIPLNESAAPLSTLSSLVGMELLGIGLTVGIAFACFSCTLASLNAAARIAFALARHSFYPAPLGEVHTQNETPHIAVSLSALVVFLLAGTMSIFGIHDIDIYGYLGTISTYGFLVAYILVSIAAPVYLSRLGRLRQHHVVTSLLAGLFMLMPVAGSFYPVPAFPYSIFPYLFLLYLSVGGFLFFMMRHRSSEISKNIDRDFEALRNQADD
jgi:amino acid transporter